MGARHRATAASTLTLLAVLWAGDAAAQTVEGAFERTVPVSGAVDLTVRTGSGRIEVRSGDARSVRIIGQVRIRSRWFDFSGSAEERVRRLQQKSPIEQRGNVIRIGDIDDPDVRRHVSISYTIVAPSTTRLTANSRSGSLDIAGLDGPVVVRTGSGGIRVRGVGDALEASTGSGGIDVETVAGGVTLRTGSGRLRARGIAGSASAASGSGSIDLEQTAGGAVDVHTGSGSVDVRGVRGGANVQTGSGSITIAGAMTDAWRVRASSGSVTVQLPADAAFDLNARTGSGSINVAHPLTLSGVINRREVRGRVRGGGPSLDVSASSGSIRIR
jgi:DUF4097 and DUF4098 domain-containing protein YvlB